ncbi:uncharacterized protein C8Q71DRAFT_859551 [Rhodofomes roseus]|uniref:Uncharacterized protein n=1 Tax=Rhodofomes roseus TaxID=34475 RepID=A0ABQ8KAT1_9APHY|nr:uncharacterized protein C8Q71DRAFT_859551 [Rhodofomes roseus]KAH9834575.1 hypothetical protein C8Q71DRAFT_859551 [Rhodofomes roseus]
MSPNVTKRTTLPSRPTSPSKTKGPSRPTTPPTTKGPTQPNLPPSVPNAYGQGTITPSNGNPWNSGRRSPGQPGSPTFAEVTTNKKSTRLQDITDALASVNEPSVTPEAADTPILTETPSLQGQLTTQPATENPATQSPVNKPQTKKNKRATRTTVTLIGLGLPSRPITPGRGTSPSADETLRTTSNQRKRRRTTGQTDDSGESSHPQPTLRAQDSPNPSPEGETSPADDLQLTPVRVRGPGTLDSGAGLPVNSTLGGRGATGKVS